MTSKKDNCLGLYLEGIRDGKPEQALDRYLGDRYTQHSAGVADGKDGFLAFFLPFLARTPDRDIKILRTIEDGSHVFCHAHQVLNGGQAQWITMDLFDTDDRDRIVEHWDVISEYEASTVSGEDMVGGPTDIVDREKTNDNKSIVKEYVKQVLTEGRLDRIDRFVGEDVVQRAPDLEGGREALRSALESGAARRCEMLFQLVGEGDLVATLSKTRGGDVAHATFDLYRLEDGRIAEHWEATESILPRAQWGNSGKF